MHRALRTGILITFGTLIFSIISGCADDDPPEQVTQPLQPGNNVPPPPTITVDVDPPPGSLIDQGITEFTLRFNQELVAVTVNDTTATGFALTWRAKPHMPLGEGQTLNITWAHQDGFTGAIEVGPYSVQLIQPAPALLTGGTVSNGETDVDPGPINAGGFQFDFDEDVTGTIKLTDEAGNDLNWIGRVAGSVAMLTPVAGQELVNETTYKVEIDVQDGSGHPTQVTIWFITKPK